MELTLYELDKHPPVKSRHVTNVNGFQFLLDPKEGVSSCVRHTGGLDMFDVMIVGGGVAGLSALAAGAEQEHVTKTE